MVILDRDGVISHLGEGDVTNFKGWDPLPGSMEAISRLKKAGYLVTIALAAAVVPMLMLDRFVHMGLNRESIVLAGALVYIIIRFGVSELLKRYTVHRVVPGENLFAVRTAGGGPGNRRAMRRVVLLTYGCQSLSLRETEPNWRAAEARGALCTGGQQRFSRRR